MKLQYFELLYIHRMSQYFRHHIAYTLESDCSVLTIRWIIWRKEMCFDIINSQVPPFILVFLQSDNIMKCFLNTAAVTPRPYLS